jgi:transcriptional regulator with XRE-family HTH domain
MTMSQLTNDAVAERLGLSHSAVSRMRRGERIASPRTAVRIAEEFGVSLDELTRASALASSGEREPWVELLFRAFEVPGDAA